MSRTAPRCALWLMTIAVAAATPGCLNKSYPEKQRYVLRAERPNLPDVSAASGATGAASSARGVLRVGRIRVSPLFDHKRFVYRTGDSSFEDDFYNEFFARPSELVRRATRDWMGGSPLFASVIESAPPSSDWMLEGKVEKLYADLRDLGSPLAVLEIEYTLQQQSPKPRLALQKTYSTVTVASGRSGAAIVSAWDTGLAEILAELEADLEREALR